MPNPFQPYILLAIASLFASLALNAQASQDSQATKAVPVDNPILIEGRSITVKKSDFEQEKKNTPPEQRALLSTDPSQINKVLDKLLLNKTLAQAAKESGFANTKEVTEELAYHNEQRLAVLYSRELARQIKFPDFEPAIKERYRLESEKYIKPEQVSASHILIGTKNRSVAEAKQLANNILEKLKAGEDFTKLAQTYSEDPSVKRNNGDLGMFGRDRMVPEFAAAAFALRTPGELSAPVETQFGVHIIKLKQYVPQQQMSIDELRPTFLEDAKRDYEATELRAQFEKLVQAQQITANRDAIEKLPNPDTVKAAKEFNERIRREIREQQLKEQQQRASQKKP